MTHPLSHSKAISSPGNALTLAVMLFAVGPMAAVARQGLVPLLIAACICAVLVIGRTGLRDLFGASPISAAALALVAWAAISTAWGQVEHLVTLLRVVIAIGLPFILTAGVAAWPESVQKIDRWIVAGGWFLAAFLLEESLSGGFLVSFLHPASDLISGWYYPRVFDYADQGAAVLAPACYAFAAFTFAVTQSLIAAAVFIAIALWACSGLPMDAATLAIILGGLAFGMAYVLPRFTLMAIFAGFIGYLLIAPIVAGLYSFVPTENSAPHNTSAAGFGWQQSVSLQQRLAVWEHTADLISQKPVLGHGFNAARDFSALDERLPGTDWYSMPLHPHNGPLQLWLELGGVGAVIFAVLLALVCRQCLSLSGRPLPAAIVAATLVAISMPMLVSFSLWNYWWIAAQGFSWVFVTRAIKLVPDRFPRKESR